MMLFIVVEHQDGGLKMELQVGVEHLRGRPGLTSCRRSRKDPNLLQPIAVGAGENINQRPEVSNRQQYSNTILWARVSLGQPSTTLMQFKANCLL